jgi:hypothetical protein
VQAQNSDQVGAPDDIAAAIKRTLARSKTVAVVDQRRKIGRQRRRSARLAAPPTNDSMKFLDQLARLALTPTGQLSEDRTLAVEQSLAHDGPGNALPSKSSSPSAARMLTRWRGNITAGARVNDISVLSKVCYGRSLTPR